ncbi:class I SAM-dependent methyltransferase [Helicobacter sp. 11S02629-2]|uniref:class I SAM-dependent methyltransferase n=1 Tax=Helicobacter sp. 11S02629-2 TaxID=1476195 RepID=UPI000BA59FA9|nr:class I SAM-dependent methyltransferase [Helicobacter sp. 11S02629-2]PAF45344.1 SAM-dependent methyltransferase [Helicobacter sp. 11S02629-2]
MLAQVVLKKVASKLHEVDPSISFELVLWDKGVIKKGDGEPKFKIVFTKTPTSKVLTGGTMDASLIFGELYMDGFIEIEGDFDSAILLLHKNSIKKYTNKVKDIKPPKTTDVEKKNIKSHYDIGNDFYKLWLDSTMSYSCAYFKTKEDSLEQAQLQKIHHTLAKLNLQKGETLLDIGCGWGYLAISAAKKYGVRVFGNTISEEQFKFATNRVKEEGLEDLVTIKLLNYQDLSLEALGLDKPLDKIVSVGMFEHVGKANISFYLSKVKSILKEGGNFLLHSILCEFEGNTNAFIDKYIFPGGYIPTLREVIYASTDLEFELGMAESLRIHYAMTLDKWSENFEAKIDEVRKMYDERFIRMWRLYLDSCASAFRVNSVNIYQLFFTKHFNNNAPLTREYIYK